MLILLGVPLRHDYDVIKANVGNLL